MTTRFVVSYDISDTKIRSRISRILEEFGERIQFSVFECDLSPEQHANLMSKLKAQSLLKEQKDCKISFYRVEPHLIKAIRRIGKKPILDREVIII